MTVAEFRSQIHAGIKLSADGKDFVVREVVKFRFDDGSFYIKCFLNDGYVFADDLKENMFLLVREMKTPIEQPFPRELSFDQKKFDFLYTAHAIAEETDGEDIFKRDASERFWDYSAKDGSYLSLGINDGDNERSDFYGKIVDSETVAL